METYCFCTVSYYIIIIKSPKEVWRLIAFAPFLIILLLSNPQTKIGDFLFLHRFLLLLASPQTKFGDLLFLHHFLLSHQTKFEDLLFLHRFLLWLPNEDWRLIVFAPFLIIIIIIKSPNEVWRLIVFAPFLIILLLLSPQKKFGDLLLLHRFLLYYYYQIPKRRLETSCFCTVSYYY